METKLSGKTVCPVVLGTVPFGNRVSAQEANRIMDAYVNAGGNIIDTANIYGFTMETRGRAERCVAAWFKAAGAKDVLISTKGAHPRMDAQGSRVRPEYIDMDCKESAGLFERPIDIYWLHRDDETFPVSELMDALFEQQDAGRILSLGASNWSFKRIMEANAYAASKKREGFIASQIQYALCMPSWPSDNTLVLMDEQKDGPDYAKAGMPVYAYTSQSRGYVAKYIEERPMDGMESFDTPDNRRRAETVRKIAAKTGQSVNAVALAYLFYQEFPCVSVVGPRTVEQLEDSMLALKVNLSAEDVRELR